MSLKESNQKEKILKTLKGNEKNQEKCEKKK